MLCLSLNCRLTRNLVTFFNYFGVEGLFVGSMVNAAAALLRKDSNLAHVLAMFFRDDILAWMVKRQTRSCEWGRACTAGSGYAIVTWQDDAANFHLHCS